MPQGNVGCDVIDASFWNLPAGGNSKLHQGKICITYHMWVFARNDVCMHASAAVRCCHLAAKLLQLAVCSLVIRLHALLRVDGSHGAGLKCKISTATDKFSWLKMSSLHSGEHARSQHASVVGMDTSGSNGLVVRGNKEDRRSNTSTRCERAQHHRSQTSPVCGLL